MAAQFGLVVSSGTVFGSTDSAPRAADVAVQGGRIAAIGRWVEGDDRLANNCPGHCPTTAGLNAPG